MITYRAKAGDLVIEIEFETVGQLIEYTSSFESKQKTLTVEIIDKTTK